MPRPRATLPPDAAPVVDSLAAHVRHLRAVEAAYLVDHEAAIAAVRAEAAMLLNDDVSASAVAAYLRDQGVAVGESLVRRWAGEAGRERAGGTPIWWEVIDHRPINDVTADLERVLGMSVSVDTAPVYQVPVTPSQIEALRAALPGVVMGTVDETYG